jgi:hypothetical protein
MRETREIVTPAGHTLVLYTYLTGREVRELQTPYLKTSEEFPKDVIDTKGLRAASFQAVQNLTIKTIIVSFDGKKDGDTISETEKFNLLDTILDLPAAETNFIIKRINEVVSPPADEEQKKTK